MQAKLADEGNLADFLSKGEMLAREAGMQPDPNRPIYFRRPNDGDVVY
jgi:hypothetical protein